MPKSPTMRRLKRAFCVLLSASLLLYAVALGSVYYAMSSSPETFGRFMSKMPNAIFLLVPMETFWMHARAGHLQVAEQAPDFTLPTLDKSTTATLGAFRNRKPVVLVFGSYT